MGESGKAPGRVAEFFWLAGAADTAQRLSEADRARLHRRLAVGRQRAEAAEALWSNGHSAEGLRLAKQAFVATLEMVGPFGDALRGETSPPRPEPEKVSEPAAADDPKAKTAGAALDSQAEAPQAQDAETASEVDEPTPKAGAAEEAPKSGAADAAEGLETSEAEPEHAEAEPEGAEAAEPEDAEAEPEGGEAAEPLAGEPAEEEKLEQLEPGYRAVLAACGLRKGRLDDLVAVQKDLDQTVLPEWDEDVTPAHGDLFQRVVAARRHVDASVAPALMSGREIGWARFSRVGGAIAVVLAASIGSYLALRTPEGVHVTASGQWAPDTGAPEWATDGDPNTEWLTPTRQTGWINITIEPPRRVERLRVLNGHNRQYNDRAVRQAAIEIYADGELVRTIDQTWPTLAPQPEWFEQDLGIDQVDRIRLVVRSFHQNGGALAEIEWE